MCGFAGIAGPHEEALLERLGELLEHRGPDDSGVYRDAGAQVGLVARRLAIIDLEGGHQPMASADGSVWIAYNGEIYNAPVLRERLEAKGHRFTTDHSDTEIVLALYQERGEEMLEELNGMFAFVIHDTRRKLLFGARDRFGIKPLYYARPGGGLAFASELRTVLAFPGVGRELDRQSLFHYLSLRFVPGERSILGDVKRLPPGHWFRYDLTSRDLQVRRWWRLRFTPDERASRAEWRERLRSELDAAVHRWTLSDVPIACSLSGGLDSSAVVSLLAQGGMRDLRTYSLGFTSEDDAELNELPLARALAEKWGTQHHELVVDAHELLDDLLAMVWALDEPYGGGLPSWYVFRFMAEDVKVGLTGSGGDELFGNYRRFVPFESGRLARLRRGDARRYHHDASYYLTDAAKRELMASGGLAGTGEEFQRIYDESGSRSARDSVLYTDFETQLPDEFLHMTDRFSMAHSLEARTPFLDHELVQLVASIPPALRTDAHDPKGLLRETIADLLTPAHLATPKRVFVFPLARWLRGELRPLAERLLDDEHLRRQGLFRPVLRERFLDPHLDGRADNAELLWPLLMFQLWHLLYVEEGLTEAPSFSWADLLAAA